MLEEVPQSFGIWLSLCSCSVAPVRVVSFPHTLMTHTENKQQKVEEKMRAKGGGEKKNTNHDGGRPNEHDEGKKKKKKKKG